MVNGKKVINLISDILLAIMRVCLVVYWGHSVVWTIFIGISVLVFFLKSAHKAEIAFRPFYFFHVILIIYTIISSLWALDRLYTYTMARSLFVSFCCYVLIYLAYCNDADTWGLIRSFKWSGYILTFYQIRLYGFNGIMYMLMHSNRITNEAGNANSIGMMISYACLFEIIEMIAKKKMTATSPLLMLSFLVMSASQSRKALLIFAIGIVFVVLFFYLDYKRIPESFLRIMIIGGITYLVLYLFSTSSLFAGLKNRMDMLVNFAKGDNDIGHSLDSRERMIEIGWQQFLKTPVLGVGMDNAKVIARMETDGLFNVYLHNNYVELLCGGGIIGFVLYYLRYVYIVFELVLHHRNKNNDYYICFIITFLLLMLDYGQVSYYSPEDQMLLILLFIQIERIRNLNNDVEDLESVKRLSENNRYKYLRS